MRDLGLKGSYSTTGMMPSSSMRLISWRVSTQPGSGTNSSLVESDVPSPSIGSGWAGAWCEQSGAHSRSPVGGKPLSVSCLAASRLWCGL